MRDWFIPTSTNGYQARLLKLPAMFAFTLVLVAVNALPFLPKSQVNADINDQDLLTLHNDERRNAGLPPLKYNAALSSSAQAKATAMLETNCWSHYCPAGKSPWDFFVNVGYDYLYAGENLGEGFFDNADVMNAWMNSPTHRENVLRPEYEEVGFGIVRGNFQGKADNILVAVHFGALKQVEPRIAGTGNGGLPTPLITSPLNGTFSSLDSIGVTGNAPDATRVSLFNNGQTWAILDANQGIFTYNPPTLTEQTYTITAQSVIGVRSSNLSNPVEFTIDRTPDPITADLLSPISYNPRQNLVTLHLNKANLAAVRLTLDTFSIDFEQQSGNIWSTQVNASLLLSSNSFSINSADLAGNIWGGPVETTGLVAGLSTLPTSLAQDRNLELIEGLTINQATVNWVFIIIFGILFFLDFATLQATGLTHIVSRKRSHWHISLFIVIILVIATGTFAGEVGLGLQL
jgi:uncharacterized protein YkwD